MIQFNLLPEVKLQYMKAKRLTTLVTISSLLVSGVALLILILMLVTVDVVQKKSITSINTKVKDELRQVTDVPDLNTILTVQNQLNTLTSLHDQKVVSSRLFGYLAKLTPTSVSINQLNVDFTANTMSISGAAPSLDSVNAFTDTLKATTYETDAGGSALPAFSQVVLGSFARTDTGATYSISFSFDAPIFSSANAVALSVPANNNGQSTPFQGGN